MFHFPPILPIPPPSLCGFADKMDVVRGRLTLLHGQEVSVHGVLVLLPELRADQSVEVLDAVRVVR